MPMMRAIGVGDCRLTVYEFEHVLGRPSTSALQLAYMVAPACCSRANLSSTEVAVSKHHSTQC